MESLRRWLAVAVCVLVSAGSAHGQAYYGGAFTRTTAAGVAWISPTQFYAAGTTRTGGYAGTSCSGTGCWPNDGPFPIQNGDCVVAQLCVFTGPQTITPPTGWTALSLTGTGVVGGTNERYGPSGIGYQQFEIIMTHRYQTSDAAPTFNFPTPTAVGVAMVNYGNVVGSGSACTLDGSPATYWTPAVSSTLTAAAFAPSSTGTIGIFAGCAAGTGETSYTAAPSPYGNLDVQKPGSGVSLVVIDVQNASGTTGPITETMPVAAPNGAISFGLQGIAGPAPTAVATPTPTLTSTSTSTPTSTGPTTTPTFTLMPTPPPTPTCSAGGSTPTPSPTPTPVFTPVCQLLVKTAIRSTPVASPTTSIVFTYPVAITAGDLLTVGAAIPSQPSSIADIYDDHNGEWLPDVVTCGTPDQTLEYEIWHKPNSAAAATGTLNVTVNFTSAQTGAFAFGDTQGIVAYPDPVAAIGDCNVGSGSIMLTGAVPSIYPQIGPSAYSDSSVGQSAYGDYIIGGVAAVGSPNVVSPNPLNGFSSSHSLNTPLLNYPLFLNFFNGQTTSSGITVDVGAQFAAVLVAFTTCPGSAPMSSGFILLP